jgi:hypothetical protein
LREISLPLEIQVDDGFVRALLLTRGFTSPEDRSRIALAPEAGHVFESVRSIRELFQHERWVVAGSIVNMLLFTRFGSHSSPERGANELMREWRRADPEWLPRYIHAHARSKTLRLLPASWWMRRWHRWGRLSLGRKLARLPMTTAAWTFDLLVFAVAIYDVKRGRGYRYWGRTRRQPGLGRRRET